MAKDWGSYKASASYTASARGQTRRSAAAAATGDDLRHPNFKPLPSSLPKAVATSRQTNTGEVVEITRGGMIDGRMQGLTDGRTLNVVQNGPNSTTYNVVNKFYGKPASGRGRAGDQEVVLAENLTRGRAIAKAKSIANNAAGIRAGGRIARTRAEAKSMVDAMKAEDRRGGPRGGVAD